MSWLVHRLWPFVSARSCFSDVDYADTGHTSVALFRPSYRYKLGDAFLHVSQPKALQLLEDDTRRVDEEIERLEKVVDECEEEMKKLKVVLYGKFGSNISK